FTGILDNENYFGDAVASLGDLNGDGFVDMADVVLVASSWGQVSGWSTAPAPPAW
ncbi:hypothetical protein LCGC14_2268690, partial [marine sediment metagenome]